MLDKTNAMPGSIISMVRVERHLQDGHPLTADVIEFALGVEIVHVGICFIMNSPVTMAKLSFDNGCSTILKVDKIVHHVDLRDMNPKLAPIYAIPELGNDFGFDMDGDIYDPEYDKLKQVHGNKLKAEHPELHSKLMTLWSIATEQLMKETV